MWKMSFYIFVLCKFHCAIGLESLVGTMTDQVGEMVDDANPTVSDEIKKQQKMNTSELASELKYNVETHEVQTEDGYFLKMIRIRNDTVCAKRIPALLVHGVFGDSSSWILNLNDQSSAYIFANAGYDIWLGNSRGNTYSDKHNKYNTSDSEYWDFTLDHLAKYDLPAMIDYILEKTGSKKLHYVGHSQGTTIMFMYLSKYCEAAKKLRTVHCYAPIAFIKHSTSLMVLAANLLYKPLQMGRKLGFPMPSKLTKALLAALYGSPVKPAFETVLQLIMGPSDRHVNWTRMQIAQHHFPCRSGVGQLAHYGQIFKYNQLCEFDYGKSENLAKYGQCKPPKYDLEKIKCENMYFYSSDCDILADSVDVQRLYCILKKIVRRLFRIKAEEEKFNHSDYMQSLHGRSRVYDITVEIMNNFDD